MKVTVIQAPEYVVQFEEHNGLTFVHCEVFTWNKTVRKRLQQEFEILRLIRGAPIFAIHETGDEKHAKFLNLFNFNYVQDIYGSDNQTRQLFVTGN